MSHTPLDGSTDGTQEGETSVDSSRADDGFQGVLARGVATLRRAGRAVSEFLASKTVTNTDGGRVDTGPDSRAQRAEQSPSRTEDRPVVSGRDAAKPVPAGGGPRDQPELVARWDEDTLTLSEPDEAGAQISSDTWSEVDP